jgi:hypothetical protein
MLLTDPRFTHTKTNHKVVYGKVLDDTQLADPALTDSLHTSLVLTDRVFIHHVRTPLVLMTVSTDKTLTDSTLMRRVRVGHSR